MKEKWLYYILYMLISQQVYIKQGFLAGSVIKNLPASAGDTSYLQRSEIGCNVLLTVRSKKQFQKNLNGAVDIIDCEWLSFIWGPWNLA